MGLLDSLLGDDGKSERSLVLKAKPLKEGGGKSGELQNFYDPKGKPLDDSLFSSSPDGSREPKLGVPHVTVPMVQPLGITPEGPTPLDAAIQERNLMTGAYKDPSIIQRILGGSLPEPLEAILGAGVDGSRGFLDWMFNLNPAPQKAGVFDPDGDQARHEAYQERIRQYNERLHREQKNQENKRGFLEAFGL